MLSVIIPTKDRCDVFKETLNTLMRAVEGMDAEVIVVNDSTTPLEVEPELFVPTVKILQNPKSGVASARNYGAANALGDLLLFLDDDILVSKKSLLHTLTLHCDLGKACVNLNWEYTPSLNAELPKTAFGRFLEYYKMTSFRGWYADETTWKVNELFPSRSIASFHLSIKKSDFIAAGGYDESFPFSGFEDYDFSERLKKSNVLFFIDSRITVFHNEVDRMNFNNWLASQERRATTRRVAVSRGYAEFILNYNVIKSCVLRLVLLVEGAMVKTINMCSQLHFFDPIAFKLIAFIQASRIFKGYHSPMRAVKRNADV